MTNEKDTQSVWQSVLFALLYQATRVNLPSHRSQFWTVTCRCRVVQVLTSLCPALASLLRTHDGDTRFFALQKFSDIMLTYVNEPTLYVPSGAPPVEGAAATAGMDPSMATATVDKLLREVRSCNGCYCASHMR